MTIRNIKFLLKNRIKKTVILYLISLTALTLLSCEKHQGPSEFINKNSEELSTKLNLSENQQIKYNELIYKFKNDFMSDKITLKSNERELIKSHAMRFDKLRNDIYKIINKKQIDIFNQFIFDKTSSLIYNVFSIIAIIGGIVLFIVITLIFFNKRLKKKVIERTELLSRANQELEDKSERLQELNRTLEERVEERTEELKEKNDILEKRNKIMENEVSMARNIQQQFIPSKDIAENFYSLYRPMEQVGGDFYDFFQFRDSKKTGIFISDVSGHGVPAAFITSMVKSIILQSGEKRHNPAELMFSLNEVLFNNTAGNFLTAFYGIFDSVTGEFFYSNAGHNLPYIINDSGITEISGALSVPISFMDNDFLKEHNKGFKNDKIIIPEKSKLFLYTDGLTEAEEKNERYKFFEDNGLKEYLLEQRDLSCRPYVDSLMQELINFTGTQNFEDDVCIICIDT